MTVETVWYAAYGSNMKQQGLERYVPSRERHSVWRQVPHARYYGGEAKTWNNGGVAFLSLNHTPEACSHVKLFQFTLDELHNVWEAENGMSFRYDYLKAMNLDAGEHDTAPIPHQGIAGKYNALLRLEDHDGLPVFTITTARVLTHARPDDSYRWRITEGLMEYLEEQQALRELGLVNQGNDNRFHLPSHLHDAPSLSAVFSDDDNRHFNPWYLHPLTRQPAI